MSKLYTLLQRTFPDGVVAVDPARVVAPKPAEAYVVLPQVAGLIQLVKSGGLRRTDDGYFIIEKPFARFPAGLDGAHSERFVLARGVPMPAGNPGSSSIVDGTIGECLSKLCR